MSKAEAARNHREYIVHSAMYGVKDYIPGAAEADKASMLAELIQMHRDGTLTEGQVSRAARIDRLTVRHLCDRLDALTALERTSVTPVSIE